METPAGLNVALEQVDHFWSILDHLSVNDQAAYKSFIHKHMRDGADYFSVPHPHSCIRTDVQNTKGGRLYVNVCGWKRVPGPSSPEHPVPVWGGRLEIVTEGKENYYVVEVAFNPDLLQRAEQNQHDIKQIHQLAHKHVQERHKLDLSRQFTVIKDKLKGSIQDVKRRLLSPQQSKPDNQNQQTEPDSQPPGTGSPTVLKDFQEVPSPADPKSSQLGLAPSLLQQICSLRLEDSTDDPDIPINVGKEQPPARPALIEVISSTESPPPQQPEHRLTVHSSSGDSARRLKLHVQLPGVNSVSQCQLSISQDDVLLEVEDTYLLQLQFPEPINDETCHATFNKKKHTLTVTATTLENQHVRPQEESK